MHPNNEKNLMYQQTVNIALLKDKKILFFAPSNGLCENPMDDQYNHFQELCLIELSEADAKKMIAKSEKIIYNEIHQRLWRNW